MGARPMARVIQEHIKKPLADEVLFGKLKNGGHCRVVVVTDAADPDAPEDDSAAPQGGEKPTGEPRLGFEFLEGRAVPKPESLPAVQSTKDKRRGGGGGGDGDGGGGGGGGGGKPQRGPGGAPPPKGSVPKIPLVKVP